MKPMQPTRMPWATILILALTFGMAFLQAEVGWRAVIKGVGIVPVYMRNPSVWFTVGEGQSVPVWATLVLYMFAHTGWAHVISNTLGLGPLGVIVEKEVGSVRFVARYIAFGIAGAFCDAIVNPHSADPLVGASLAACGVAAAFMGGRASVGRSKAGMHAIRAAEIVTALAAVSWLLFRTIPPKPNFTSSIMCHGFPLILGWFVGRLESWRRGEKVAATSGEVSV